MKKKILTAAILLLVALQSLTFAGCASSTEKSANLNEAVQSPDVINSTNATTGTYGALAATDNNPNGGTQVANASGTNNSPSNSLDTTDVSKSNTIRKVIMSASLSLQTTTYDKSTTALEGLVNQYGGFIQDSSTQGTGVNETDQLRTASYTVRVPSDKLGDFISNAGTVGKLISKSETGDDISKDYYDSQTQLTTLKAEQQRVIAIMNKTTNMNDMLSAENRLSDIDNEINQLTGELQQWDSLVDLSTVTITINEVKQISIQQNGFGGQIGAVFSESIGALATTFEVLLKIVIAILPFVIVFGGIALLTILFMRLFKKRDKKNLQNSDESHIIEKDEEEQ